MRDGGEVSTGGPEAVHVDWAVPPGPRDWLYGTGATRVERGVVWLTAAACVTALLLTAPTTWSWGTWLAVLLVTLDVTGGVAANALGTAKRLYHAPLAPPVTRLDRVLHDPLAFAALHVHPFVLVVVVPDATWVWALWWYLVPLGGVVLVRTVPVHLQRPVALGVAAVALVAAPVVGAPDGLSWFGPVMVLKLVVAHAVREEPYRPAPREPGVGQGLTRA
ncbi:hypothetical protein [Cellulomonas fimi]|uniref:Uncharacterized protein n=1 Tax=Cellulomonas fimi (strain ATCC 484 / DSM 20113 / JCM 1341 / CCUG 24087 / LMG 16345 / NBRC 15513 / NCIMB 8980 / NCTC 7547 / NRS-133) TaxID=590998 RepID=F4H342_CELFA|nr:hypothetical protein [Cellulomonas fimi]AEE47660.1 hypothetical protein Celf_3549 [Cellulomonas fimi ATCC 484]NNH09089.1 hypothetical protein [Cellulomonas fimi]VEH36741.1 Uncharacterised protein [Cellulomonas fimi]